MGADNCKCKAQDPCGLGLGRNEFSTEARTSRERYDVPGMDDKQDLLNDIQASYRPSQRWTNEDMENFLMETGGEPSDVFEEFKRSKNHDGSFDDDAVDDAHVVGDIVADDSYFVCYFQQELPELADIPLPQGGPQQKVRSRYTFRSGAVFDGEWLGRERHGYGHQIWSDGAAYQGQWQHNNASGLGKFTRIDGDMFYGQWVRNVTKGNGVYQHRDGTKYAGQFEIDLQDGYGMETWPDGSRFSGQFIRGTKTGFGIYEWSDGSRFEGDWRGNQMEGPGSYTGSDKQKFDGQWRSSSMHSYGRYQWPDGRHYVGQYVDDQKDGFGILTWPDGQKYEGYWYNDRQHGLGRFCKAGEEMRLSTWVNGDRVS